MKLHGIVNCDTVKKARAWLDARGMAYEWVDFKQVAAFDRRPGALVPCGRLGDACSTGAARPGARSTTRRRPPSWTSGPRSR